MLATSELSEANISLENIVEEAEERLCFQLSLLNLMVDLLRPFQRLHRDFCLLLTCLVTDQQTLLHTASSDWLLANASFLLSLGGEPDNYEEM